MLEKIKNHQGSLKFNWFWKSQLLNNQLLEVCPVLFVTAKQILPSLKNFNTFNVYKLTDVTLHGNTLGAELVMDDPANSNRILPATRTDCRTIGLTFAINPRAITPQGAMVDVAKLPEPSSFRVYVRAPLNAVGGGLLNSITKDMLLNNATATFILGVDISFLAIKHGQIPLKDVFDAWIKD